MIEKAGLLALSAHSTRNPVGEHLTPVLLSASRCAPVNENCYFCHGKQDFGNRPTGMPARETWLRATILLQGKAATSLTFSTDVTFAVTDHVAVKMA